MSTPVMDRLTKLSSFRTLLACLIICVTVNCAVMHVHSSHGSHEREEDGAYSPRDRGHYGGSQEHHSEFDHEAILGSVKEAEEFDNLPPEEAKERLVILLKKMDLNRDQQIDRQELRAWIMRSFKMLAEEEAQERLEEVDENSDGKVTWDEYAEDTYGKDDDEAFALPDLDKMSQDDRQLWDVADADNDGVLTGAEWVAFSQPEEHPSMIPVIVNQTLRDKDTDRDGSISFQEFIADRGEHQDKDWLTGEKDKFDKELDLDRDGKLTGNEITSWIVPSNDDIAGEEVDHLFAASDDDGDDVLSFEEVLEHIDTFVGSEATDYGDHLHNIYQFKDEL